MYKQISPLWIKNMKNGKRILIIAAHPDDDILGCGGFIAKYIDLIESIKVVFIAEGSSCRFKISEIGEKVVLDEIDTRNEMGRNALKILGVTEYSFHDLKCGRLDELPIIDINQIIESEINEFKPDTVFTHSESDLNNDHRIVFRSSLMATRPLPNFSVKNIYSYEVLSSSEWNLTDPFKPNYYIQLDEIHIEKKINALEKYYSEVKDYPFPRSITGIRTLAQLRGMQIGVKFAEAFKLIRGCDL